MNCLNKYSYKALSFCQHNKFVSNNVIQSPLYKTFEGQISLFSNIQQLKTHLISNHNNQSCVLYKFDNNKIPNLNYHAKNNLFLTEKIPLDSVIVHKLLYFDSNRINEYFNDLDNLDKYLEKKYY